MSYKVLLGRVQESIQEQCRQTISKEWENLYTLWLSIDAPSVFGSIYEQTFQEHFGTSIDVHMKKQAYNDGTNLAVGLYTFLDIHDGVLELDDMLRYTRLYIDRQLHGFNTWCYELRETVERSNYTKPT
jgi:hypothetical protein